MAFGKAPLTYANFNGLAYGAANYNYPYYIYDVPVGHDGYCAENRV